MTSTPDRDPDTSPTDEDVESRAHLLPEEQHAGSDDPEAQARAILEDSNQRTEAPDEARDESTQTPGETA